MMARSEKHEAHTGSYHMNLRGVACALAGGALWGFSGTAVSYRSARAESTPCG